MLIGQFYKMLAALTVTMNEQLGASINVPRCLEITLETDLIPIYYEIWLAFLAVSKRAILTRATRVLDMLGKFKRKDKLCSCL